MPANAQLLSQKWLDLPLPASEIPKVDPKLLLKTVDWDHRYRYDPLLGDPKLALERSRANEGETMLDNLTRTQLLDRNHSNRIRPGDVVLVESIASKTRPIKQQLVGIVLAIKRRGVASNIIVRTQIMRTAVEYCLPVYSPLITRIKVLASESKQTSRHELETKSKLYHLRDRPNVFARLEEASKKLGLAERELSKMMKEPPQ